MRQKAKQANSYVIKIVLLFFLISAVLSISGKVLYPVSSNMGLKTDYYMSFKPDQTYTVPNLNLKLTIPIEYELSQIKSDLECYVSTTGKPGSYVKFLPQNCYIQPITNSSYSTIGELIIKVDSLISTNPIHFVFRNIINPLADSSSFFGLCIRASDHLLQCDKQFKMLTFTKTFLTFVNGLSISTSPLAAVVGQGTTYYLKFKVDIANLTLFSEIDSENVQIRVVFPKQFQSSNPICSMLQYNSLTQTYGTAQTQTALTPSKSNSVQCKKIQKFKASYINVDIVSIKIQNIQNPFFSNIFVGLYIEILRGGRNQIIQRVDFANTITIDIKPQQIDGQVKQTNMMRNSTNEYFFYLTHDLNYAQNSQIKLTVVGTTLWEIHGVKLMFGFTDSNNFTSIIKNTVTQSSVSISNYGVASKQVQQIIAVNLTSSDYPGDHIVKIETLIDNQLSGSWQGKVKLNSTWGSFNMLSFSAVQQPTKLPVGKTGPLQLTLFLNYELPQSQNIQNGSMTISITPKIIKPDPDIYGQVKCYFKATLQAANCIFDDFSDPLKTKITLVSPPYDQFQFSQIPIIITTQGGIDEDHLGLPISPIVQRYKFEVQFYLYNSSVIPSQVLYTNWIADAIQLPSNTFTGQSITHECSQWTSLHLHLVTPLMNLPEQRLVMQFLNDENGRNAWDIALGYDNDKIYKQFPCVLAGTNPLIGDRIRCDLYTYVNNIGPYNKQHIQSKYFGPFIVIYGFQSPVITGSAVDIYLPGIRISNQLGAKAVVSLSILQQNPGQTQPYIQLYHKNLILFTTLAAPSLTLTTINTAMPQIQVQTTNLYTTSWNPVSYADVAYIKYDFTNNLPQINTLFNTCTGSTCYSSGYPNNWIIQIPNAGLSGSVTTPYTLTTSLSIKSMPYVNTLPSPHPVKITTYDASGHTLQLINIAHQYTPQLIVTGSFNLLDSALTMYSGLKQWYQVQFVTVAAVTSTYPFVRLRLNSQLVFAQPEQCESTTMLAFNQTGIKCDIVSGSSKRQLIVWNIKSIDPATAYKIKVRLQTAAADYSAIIYPKVSVYINHNQSIIDSLVQYVENVALAQSQIPQMAKPNEFTIQNPQILNQQVRVNYIGRLFIDFTSTIMTTKNLKLNFPNHRYTLGMWKTPNGLVSDPVVCMLNGKRFYCDPTISPPLSIIIKNAQIMAGQNRLQIDTEYIAPFNGLVFPAFAGNYQIGLSTIDPGTSSLTSQHTFYVYIHPPPLEDIQIASIVKDINTESVYILNFTIPSTTMPNANHDPVTYARIFIEFPTIQDGVRVFQDNLGPSGRIEGYEGKLNQRVGCAFLKGTSYISAQPSKLLQCRLIPPQIPGAPVKVQVINFNAFSPSANSLGLFIFKVFNPVTAHNSVQIKVKINHYAALGQINPLYQSDFVVFLDPRGQNTTPANQLSIQSQLSDFFDITKDVGDAGKIQIKAQTINPTPILPYYMLVKLPSYLPVQNDQLLSAFTSCPPSNFQYCMSAPDVNYVLVKARTNLSFFEVNIENYPLGISQVDSKFYSMIIEQGRYAGNIEYIISQQKRWIDIRGDILNVLIQPVGLTQKLTLSKQRFQVAISFKTSNYIPSTGTIQISFPPSVTKIYPYCRSAYANNSKLFAQSGTSGEIGCAVQHGNKWAITGFKQVPASSVIIINGYIDLPSVPGTLGTAEIITYANNHPSDIYTNGSQIDYINPFFNLNVPNDLAMNTNQNVFLTQRDVIRINSLGEFRLVFKLGATLQPTGYMNIDFAKNDISGGAGGFVLTTSEKKVCQFIRISDQTRIGCQVFSQQQLTTAGQSYIRFSLRSYDNIAPGDSYQVRLTTQKYSQPTTPQGIHFPSIASTYKIQVTTRYSSPSTSQTTQQLYLDIYGEEFKYLKVTQYNYIQGQYNPYWFQIQPRATIQMKDQLVIQFPTKSNDGVTKLFSENLGLSQYKNGNTIAFDIFDDVADGFTPTDDFMSCNIFHGDFATGMPVKIVCGDFLYNIALGMKLQFAIAINNPLVVSAQISIPLMIYSMDPLKFVRTNYNLVTCAGYIYAKSNILSKLGFPTTSSLQMEKSGDQFFIGNAHTYNLLTGDAYVLKFGFPLRVNGFIAGGCMDGTGAVLGNAYYHNKLRTIVCKVTAAAGIPLQLTPVALGPRLKIAGFYTPWYYLASSQQKIYAIAHYYSTTSSQIILYTDVFPILAPRYTFTSAISSTLDMIPVLTHNIRCQRQDYIFKITLDTLAPTTDMLNLKYTKLIGIVLPLSTTVDYKIFGRDCVQHSSSSIQIKLCQINQVARTIYIQIVPGLYANSRVIAIQTKGLAIANPCALNPSDKNQLVVNFFSWQNITASDQRANNRVYMTMDSRNMASAPLNYLNQQTGSANDFFYPFDWVQIPHERYFTQFHQFKPGQYSPFKFDLFLTAAISAQTPGQYNLLTLNYGNNYDVPSPEDNNINDMRQNVELCYLMSNRVSRCHNDYANKKITMSFQFGLPTTEWINVYFSIQDPKDKQINGFYYKGSDSDISADVTLQLKDYSSLTSQLFTVNPFQAKQTIANPTTTVNPQRTIINGQINYANSLTQQLNLIQMTFILNTPNIRGLKFEIPLVDEFGVQIFINRVQAFMDLEDGDQYPCGNNDPLNALSGKAKCYLFHGSQSYLGQHATIIMTDFVYTTQIKARLLIKNPVTVGVWFTIIVKAYEGLNGGQNSVTGHKYAGYWRFYNVFQTVDKTSGLTLSASTVSSTAYVYPSNLLSTLNPLWSDLTSWRITGTPAAGSPQAVDQYVIFQGLLSDQNSAFTQKQFCQVDWTVANTYSDDMLIYKSRQTNQQRVFFIKKWTATQWLMSYFKCKHYRNPINIYYHSSKLTQSLSIFTIPFISFIYPYSASTIRYYQVMQMRTFIQLDLSLPLSQAVTNNGLNWENEVDYAMYLTVTGMTFDNVVSCQAVGGFQNLQGQPILCIPTTSTILIKNFNKLLPNANGLTTIKIDVNHNIVTPYPQAAITVNAYLYAGPDAHATLQYMLYTVSNPYLRRVEYWLPVLGTYIYVAGAVGVPLVAGAPPTWTAAQMTLYNNYYIGLSDAKYLFVELQMFILQPALVTLTVKVKPNIANIIMQQNLHNYFIVRFYIQGVSFSTCGAITTFQAVTNYGAVVDLKGGFVCGLDKNYFYYSSYTHSINSGNVHKTFSSLFTSMGSIFQTTQFITFSLTMVTAAVDPSWTRDWVGIKAFIHTYYLIYSSPFYYYRYKDIVGYGQGYHIRNQLFSSGVSIKALSNLINEETELQIRMAYSTVIIGATTTDKLLLLEFNTPSNLFTYINTTATNNRNHLIQCNCMISTQSDYSGGTTFKNLNCYLRLPQESYTNSAISINIQVPIYSYVKCFFPGFIMITATTLHVTAKIINQGVNQASYPTAPTQYGSVYATSTLTTAGYTFVAGTILNAPFVTQFPDIYESGTSPVTIKTPYSNINSAGYSLTVDFLSNSLTTPIFYINFQKGGPVADESFCSLQSKFQFCRVYSKYRNIIVSKFSQSPTTTSVNFISSTAVTPSSVQPLIGGTDYDMIVYVKSPLDTQYTYKKVTSRAVPTNLKPSTTTLTVMPDRLTSNKYETFTSNLVISFKLQGHQLLSFYKQQAKLQIHYSNAAYVIARKGCTVTTDVINDDQMFAFYCEVDTTTQLIKIQNRYYDKPFSAANLLQVVVGVTNQAQTNPVTFTLRLYKWYLDATNYGLLIQKQYIYTPKSVTAPQTLQQRNRIRMYPFHARIYSDIQAPFRMALKFPSTMITPLSYVNYLTSYLILQDFVGIAEFATVPQLFECYIKQFTSNPTVNIQPLQTNGYRNYKQNLQYYFVPTYCLKLNTTALKMQIPRNRPLDNTKYYQLVIMPVSLLKTGFANVVDDLSKLVVFPVNTAQHIFALKQWKKAAFTLTSFWLVTTRPQVPTALQISFSTTFSQLGDFPLHYLQIIFNNLDLSAIYPPYNQVGETVPCSLSSQFKISTQGIQKPNCIVTYADKLHQVIKIRVQNFKTTGPSSFKLSLDYFLLPSLSGPLLQKSNTFSVCMVYWSTVVLHQRCFGQMFIIDGYINTSPFPSSTTLATFKPQVQKQYGASNANPAIGLLYPKATTNKVDQKLMIKITGGYSAVNTAPMSFTGSTFLWYNPMLNLYIQRLGTQNLAANHQISFSSTRNPFPYEMQQYLLVNQVQLTYYSGYHPHSHYLINQLPYSTFIKSTLPLVRLGTSYLDDIKTSTKSSTQSLIQLSIQNIRSLPSLKTYQNNRLQIQFSSNVIKVKRCWVTTTDPFIAYSGTTVCTPKPSQPTKLQLLNYNGATRTDKYLKVYAIVQIISSPITVKSHLYASNDQQQFESQLIASISSVNSAMTAYSQLTFTESHYSTGYYEPLVTPITHGSVVKYMYLSFFLPQNLVQANSIFTVILNTTLSIFPANYTLSTRLICEWMKVSKYGRQYQTGKFSHCQYITPNIVIKAPTWNLPAFSGTDRIPYLLKIRQESPTSTLFTYPLNSQVQEIVLQSNTGGFYKRDTLVVHPYQHFNGLFTKHTTLTAGQLNTYQVQFSAPASLGVGTQYVLTLEIDNRYMHPNLGIQDIYATYGQDSQNSSIINNLQHNMVYSSLPNKWINGIPYSCNINQVHAAQQTCISISDKSIRINLLLATHTGGIKWKIPLLRNPVTRKPIRMNLTLWSYPLSTQGHKQLFYQIINEHVTKLSAAPGLITYDIQATAQANNKIQSSTNSLSVQFPAYAPTTNDVIEMKILARAVGIIDIPSFNTPSFLDLSYDFYFFKNINFLIAKKNTNSISDIINLNKLQVSNQYSDDYGYEWLKVHSASTLQTVKVGPQLKKSMPACNIPSITCSFQSGSGTIENTKSQVKFQFITPCNIPINSTLKLIAPTSEVQFLPMTDQTYCQTSFRSMGCWLDSSKMAYIRINELILAGTTMSITTFIKSKVRSSMKNIQGVIYAIPDKPTTLVNTITATAVFPITSVQLLSQASVFPLLIKPLYENKYSKIIGTFNTAHLPVNQLDLLSPFSKLISSNQTFYYQANTTSSQYLQKQDKFNSKWIRTLSSTPTNFASTQTILPDGTNSYAIQMATQYWFTLGSMYETTMNLNNYLIGSVGSYYQFEYKTLKQIAYHQVYPVPQAQTITVRNPLTHIGQQTVLGIDFSMANQDIHKGDIIQIQLDSHNLIENMYSFTNELLQCAQLVRGTLTQTTTEQIVCEVNQYPDAATKTPMKIHVYPTKTTTIIKTTQISIWISPIINSVNVLVAGVTVKLLKKCGGQELCTMYQGRGWYRTTSMTVNNHGITGTATFTPISDIVLKQNSVHKFTFAPILLVTTFVKYPQNYQHVMPLTCTTIGICLVFSKQRKIVTLQSQLSVSQLQINGMTNGIYVFPEKYINLKLATTTSLEKYLVNHGVLNTRKTMPLNSDAANTFTITNTQNSNNVFLRNYWNTVKMQIEGLYTSQFIKAFYINAPQQVKDWDPTYCNATIQSPNHNPYPTRLQCMSINETTIRIKIPQGVSYQLAVSQLQTLTVHAKFWLKDFPTGMISPSLTIPYDVLYVSPDVPSDFFHAYGSFQLQNQSQSYFITQASTQIQISRHKTPLISQVAFNTQSFEQRLASVNDKTTFQILIDPTTIIPIDYIQVVIPQQFRYPNVLYHDMCKLIHRRTTQLPSCKQTRKDNQTIITIDIDHTLYDNGPRILQIASNNVMNWFTAPSMPGSFYNMTISLYGIDGSLLQKQSTKNSSIIKGHELKLNQIIIQNGRDQLQQQIYDIKFKVGPQGIKQGYRGILAKGQYHSQIKVKFQTQSGYEYLLGGYYPHGARVGCVTSLQSMNNQIACIFDKGTNINDQPSITITNYEQVPPNQQITISLANIKNLPLNLRSTVAVQVKYYKVGDDTQSKLYSFNMYEPAQAITKATTALSFVVPLSFQVSYPGQTIVNQPATFQIVLKPTVTIDCIVVKFPKNGLRDQFSRFNVQCPNCNKVQIFYRAQVIRIYPLGGSHSSGVPITYTLTGFPSTQYTVYDSAYPITIQAYSNFKIVNKQTKTITLNMIGCRLNGGVIAATSPYGGDTGVSYTFEVQVNVSKLSRSDQLKQMNIKIELPQQSTWFSPQSSCSVQLPLYCYIEALQRRLIIKNLLSYTKPSIIIKTLNILNPSSILTQTNLTFTSTLYEQTLAASSPTQQQQNTICLGTFNFVYLPSPPNICSLSLKSQHESTVKSNILSFGIVCQQTIKNSTCLYLSVPRQFIFNNPTSDVYNCWTGTNSILLDSTCTIVFVKGSYYFKTNGQLNIVSNILQLQLNIKINNPLIANNYVFNSSLQHSGNFYSTTNSVSLAFYAAASHTQLNTSISMGAIPQEAGANAIYVIRLPTQILNDKALLNFGSLAIDIKENTKISYYQPNVSKGTTTSDTTNWMQQQSYFSLLQQTYTNQLTFSLRQMSDLSQNIMIDTSSVSNTVNNGWTYIILSPITNPSSSDINDQLSVKIFQTTRTSAGSYDTLVNQNNVLMNLTIQNPPVNVYQTKYSVLDNDILSSTQHTITFTLDHELYANQNGNQNLQIIIDPPTSSLTYIQKVQVCLYYPNMVTLVQCGFAVVGQQQLSFKPKTANLTIFKRVPFIIQLRNITNPQNQTFCGHKIATEKDYLASYFQLKIFVGMQLQYQSVFVGMIDDSNKPCVQFKSKKGDILHNLPSTLYAGFQTSFNLTVTQPTANLRVFISTNDSDITFPQSLIYFSSYQKTSLQLKAIVSSNAINKFVQIKLTKQQTLGLSTFRQPQPFVVKIIEGNKQTVTIYQMQSASVGYDIKIPIVLSKPSVSKMTLVLTVLNSTAIQPYLQFFTFSQLEIAIPALSSGSSLTVRYNGTKIPPTLNITLKLISQNNPTHYLLKQVVYLHFAINSKYQTLPPVMKMDLIWLYKSNKDMQSRTVYYCCEGGQQQVNQKILKPVIIKHQMTEVTSTKAHVQLWTTNQATLFYQLLQRGKHFQLQSIKPQGLRLHSRTLSAQTLRNSSKIVNVYQVLNFTQLQHQTQYYLYVSPFDAFGDGQTVTIIKFKTNSLSTAIKFNLNSYTILTDQVMIVKSLADILQIDMRRIKVISSEKTLNRTHAMANQNKPIYAHQIVISPSPVDDYMSPQELFKSKLLNNLVNQGFLKQKIPQWTGNFNPISQYQTKKSFYDINRVRPQFKQSPYAQRISYYNATIKVKLWSKSRVIAVMIVDQSNTPQDTLNFMNTKPKGKKISSLTQKQKQYSPTSKQIIKGLNQFNDKLPAKYSFTGLTNQNGQGYVYFTGLKPGSHCKVYLAATNPEEYEPSISLGVNDAQVYVIQFNLMWNPNLKGNNHIMLDQLKKKNQKMYQVIKQYYKNQENANKAIGKSEFKQQA